MDPDRCANARRALLAVAAMAVWVCGLVVTWVNLGVAFSLAAWVWLGPGAVLAVVLWREQRQAPYDERASTRPTVEAVPASRSRAPMVTSAALVLMALALVLQARRNG